MDYLDVKYNEDGNIIDTLSGQILNDTPEERVRQKFINILELDYGYPKSIIRREIPIQNGSKVMIDKDTGGEIRADIVIYNSEAAALNKDQGNI